MTSLPPAPPSPGVLALERAIAAAGGPSRLARIIGVPSNYLCAWRRTGRGVPGNRVDDVARKIGVPAHLLRPDLRPRPAAPAPLSGAERAALVTALDGVDFILGRILAVRHGAAREAAINAALDGPVRALGARVSPQDGRHVVSLAGVAGVSMWCPHVALIDWRFRASERLIAAAIREGAP